MYIDGLVQDCSISTANELEKLQSCTKPSLYKIDHFHSVTHCILIDISLKYIPEYAIIDKPPFAWHNGLAPIRCQANISINDGIIYWNLYQWVNARNTSVHCLHWSYVFLAITHRYAWIGFYELIQKKRNSITVALGSAGALHLFSIKPMI